MDYTALREQNFMVGRLTSSGLLLLGSCFKVNQDQFVTAAHVSSNDDKDLVIVMLKTNDLTTYQDTSNKEVIYYPAKIKSIDPIRDIAVLNSVAFQSKIINISTSDNVNVGESLYVTGYPHCDVGRTVLTYQNTFVGAKILINTSGVKSKHLVLNIQTRPGQSGSPVFKSETNDLIGMIIGAYLPQTGATALFSNVDIHTLHQTTHAISSEYILNML